MNVVSIGLPDEGRDIFLISDSDSYESPASPEKGLNMGAAVIYASKLTKHTKAAAEYIAKRTGSDIFNLKDLSRIDISGYDTIVFGTGIHAGKPYKPVVDFIQNNKDALADKKKLLFIECIYNNEKGEAQRAKVSEELGIPDSIFLNTKDEKMNEDGFPAKIDDFIARI